MPPEAALSATDAMRVLRDLPGTRDTLNGRAGGLALIMWAMVFASTAGSLVILDKLTAYEMTNGMWALFLLANIGTVAAWATVGAVVQNMIWSSFNLPRLEGARWKGPAIAFATAFGLVFSNLLLQGLMRAVQGLDGATSSSADIHHNLGFAFALGIGGALVAAVSVLMRARGFRSGPGIVAGFAMILAGHLTTFLWFPDLGVSAVFLAVAAMPVALMAFGVTMWRRG